MRVCVVPLGSAPLVALSRAAQQVNISLTTCSSDPLESTNIGWIFQVVVCGTIPELSNAIFYSASRTAHAKCLAKVLTFTRNSCQCEKP